MRPGHAVTDSTEPRPRKLSSHDQTATPSDRLTTTPSTFFLTRDVDGSQTSTDRRETSRLTTESVSSLQDFLNETDPAPRRPRILEGRRRSTIKPSTYDRSRRNSSHDRNIQTPEPVERSITPSPLPSQAVSLPDSPKSLSSRSVPKSDDELVSDDASSQAVASSEDDGDADEPIAVQDSQPELIMPSINIPSRRPFTERGKQIGRLKILVAGHKGSGKTSLIKSIVQVCEDIVHVDPLAAGASRTRDLPVETFASTKPYPAWWLDLDESRILRRRKSMGDAVLERNLCFVDTASSRKLDHIISYAEQQLSKAIDATSSGQHDFAALISGRGGSQVDVILYLISKDHLSDDLDRITRLSELCNVVTLIARSDLLSRDEVHEIKNAVSDAISMLPRPSIYRLNGREDANASSEPYAITSVNGPDLDTMDASLLMSPEYVQPLLPSELSNLIDTLFDLDTIAYLKHTSAKKLVTWHATHPPLTRVSSPTQPPSTRGSVASPQLTSLSNSGVLIPQGSELSLNTSNSYALARVADHSQREERLAQIRLSKWASELQLSLQRERERFERLARNERAIWLLEKMGEEVRDGQIVTSEDVHARAMVRQQDTEKSPVRSGAIYQMHDPLGLLQWRHSLRTRGWIALQVIGSVGVVGGLAFFWMATTRGLSNALGDRFHEMGTWLGVFE